MLNFLSIMFFIVGAVFAYWFWIRPLLAARPRFAEFYAQANSFWEALLAKLRTIRTRLSAVLLMVSSALVGLHDFLMPIVLGIDWTPVTQQVPAWVWPFVSFAIGALFLWLRNLTSKTDEKVLEAVEAGASVPEAKVAAGVMPSADNG